MSRAVLKIDVLEKLRTIGDPILAKMPASQRTLKRLRLRADLLPATFEVDPEKLVVAQRLYGDYTAEISGALLLAALPQSYATEYGAAVLGAHGELTHNLTQRIGRTAEFLVTVLQKGPVKPTSQRRMWDWRESADVDYVGDLPWAACMKLRITHQRVRDQLAAAIAGPKDASHIKALLGEENVPPLNQEDLLGMQLMFSFVVFEVLDRFGITWSTDEQEAYLHLWDVVGGYLAIGSDAVRAALKPTFEVPTEWIGLRPPSIDLAHCLVDQIRTRQWIDPTPAENVSEVYWTSLRSGRVLVRALLDELEQGMPPVLKPLPIAVMRALNPAPVCERLNLGSNGVLLQALSLLPKREVRVGRFTSVRSSNKLAGRVLRSLANDVTARASVHLGEEFDLTIPGAPDWHHTA